MSKEKKDGNWFKKHKILTAILIVVVIGVIASASSGGGDNKTASNSNNQTANNETAGLNTPARDGKFEFVVKGLECGVMSVGSNPYLTKTPQGQFCLLNVTVKNIGNEKQSLYSGDQKLLNGEIEYSADDTATLYDAPEGTSWFNDINPGNMVEGKIVFDVPKDVTPTVAELHDSAFSGGVKVNLE